MADEKKYLVTLEGCGGCKDAVEKAGPQLESGEVGRIHVDPAKTPSAEQQAAMEAVAECDSRGEDCSVAFPSCVVKKGKRFEPCDSAPWES